MSSGSVSHKRSTYRVRGGDGVWRYEDGEPVARVLGPSDDAAHALQDAYNRGDSDGYRERARSEWDNAQTTLDERRANMAKLVEEWEAEHGPITEEEVRRIDKEWQC